MKNLILISVWLLSACPIFGQAAKVAFNQADYENWGTLRLNGISENGNWLSLGMFYESGKDTLFLIHTKSGRRIPLPKGTEPTFSREYFACQVKDSLVLVNLKVGSLSKIEGTRFILSKRKNMIFYLKNKVKSSFVIQKLSGLVLHKIENVTNFSLSPDQSEVLYCGKMGDSCFAGILKLDALINKPLVKEKGNYENLEWSKNGNGLSFLKSSNNASLFDKIFHFDVSKGQLLSYKLADSMAVITNGIYRHFLSEDGSRVFFYIRPKILKMPDPKAVEVWKGSDYWTYNLTSLMDGGNNIPKMAVWTPSDNSFKLISTNQLPYSQILNGGRFALLSNPEVSGREALQFPPRDYYLMDLEKKTIELLLKQQSGPPEQIKNSPDGQKLIYYKNGWKMTDISTRKETAIIDTASQEWSGNPTDYTDESKAFGFAGFADDGKSVFLYDRFDIWQAGIDMQFLKKLTNGKEHGIRFRFAPDNYLIGLGNKTIKTPLTMLLSAYHFTDASSGYFELKKGKLKKLAFQGDCIDQLISFNGNYCYREQSFSRSPVAVFTSKEQRKVVYKSNTSKEEFKRGFSKMMTYHSQGKELLAAVFYPPDYNPNIKYPIIVHIYEGLSRELHHFVNPSLQNPEGFNIANENSDGYVAVMPDLLYRVNDPGTAAAQSLQDLGKHLVEVGIADKDRIGLIGHSFGGYETFFAMTCTSVFATAVAGSGVSDLVFNYHTMSKYMNRPEMWRFQDLQFRMDTPFYLNPDAYLRNSPIVHVGKVKQPILIYSGKMDTNVVPDQSMAFYLGLRRMGIATNLLLYPDEQHVISDEKNQKDLTKRIKAWFDHYLKDAPAEDWMDVKK